MKHYQVADLKASLPNFPDEVIEDWLLTYANSEGWPPSSNPDSKPEGRWLYLLSGRSLNALKSIKWQEHARHISISELNPKHQEISCHIVLGAVNKQVNLYSASIPDLAERFERILSYIRENGTLPKAPTLFASPLGLEVLDGNHRLAAYFYAYGYFELPEDTIASAKVLNEQRFWVGTIATQMTEVINV